ncbi:hypothetical protein AVEN_268293-1 [Araneus ventricosus]|uniref:Uncharacterized protein n=1 Tax=Araneus ventricosus TaxID=182803 RepID=A0A4Y2C268_ARAVE|nr:hypothetical protein AVEN_268293-1 [Araneus ventricosus]
MTAHRFIIRPHPQIQMRISELKRHLKSVFFLFHEHGNLLMASTGQLFGFSEFCTMHSAIDPSVRTPFPLQVASFNHPPCYRQWLCTCLPPLSWQRTGLLKPCQYVAGRPKIVLLWESLQTDIP